MSDIQKECKKHGHLKKEDIRISKNRKYTYLCCRICSNECIAKWNKENKDKRNSRRNELRKENITRFRDYEAKQRKLKPDQFSLKNILARRRITKKQYVEMHEKQNGLCSICSQPEVCKSRTKGKIKRLSLDHNHITGKNRELLCHDCNKSLGLFSDSITELENEINTIILTGKGTKIFSKSLSKLFLFRKYLIKHQENDII